MISEGGRARRGRRGRRAQAAGRPVSHADDGWSWKVVMRVKITPISYTAFPSKFETFLAREKQTRDG